ncbi:MAG TPA: homocitrate synthase [Chloroflexia bacterium]|nr:homocitrate synthase [Chloroflexia bacterium]
MRPIHPVQIVDSTLREGEQFAGAQFRSADRRAIAEALDAFGVDYLELTSPAASPQSAADLRLIAALPLRARVLAHTRCTLADVQLAAECGVAGVNLLFGTSPYLRTYSHGRGLAAIIAEATQAIRFLQQRGLEVRFSCEDAFRTPLADLLTVYRAVAALGVQRVGIADTVGIATPWQVADVVGAVRAAVGCDIEFHGHNDGGCAIANAYAAILAGATHIDTTVLGIGERNGITALSGLIARLYLTDPTLVARYRLPLLPALDAQVAALVGVAIPFNSCITGATAFTHKAGLHTSAVLREPRTYEVLDPGVFGRDRAVLIGHRLTGRHALARRAGDLGLHLSEPALRTATARVKALADDAPLTQAQLDGLLREHAAPTNAECGVRSAE